MMLTPVRRSVSLLGSVAIALTSAVAGLGAASAASSVPALHVTSDTVIPGSDSHHEIVAGESPEGTVYVAVPVSSATDDIDALAGSHAAKVFATVPAGTVAITASATRLFVAGKHAISSFSLATGAFQRTWEVKAFGEEGDEGRVMVYGDHRLWVVGNAGHGQKVIKINPATASFSSVGSGHNVGSLAVGPRGVYFVRSGGHTLIRVAADGHRVTEPTHEAVSETLSGPGALQAIAINGDTLLVEHAAGQGLDAAIVRYNATTLAHLTVAGTDVAHAHVVPTAAGLLVVLTSDDETGCPNPAVHACVSRISATTAKAEATVKLPSGAVLSALLGPAPAVVVAREGHAHLIRVS